MSVRVRVLVLALAPFILANKNYDWHGMMKNGSVTSPKTPKTPGGTESKVYFYPGPVVGWFIGDPSLSLRPFLRGKKQNGWLVNWGSLVVASCVEKGRGG